MMVYHNSSNNYASAYFWNSNTECRGLPNITFEYVFEVCTKKSIFTLNPIF